MMKKFIFLCATIILTMGVLWVCDNDNGRVLKNSDIKIELLNNGSSDLRAEEKIPETAILMEDGFDEKGVLVKTFLDNKENDTVIYLILNHSAAIRHSKIQWVKQKEQKIIIGVDVPKTSGLFSIEKYLYKIEINDKITKVNVKEVKN